MSPADTQAQLYAALALASAKFQPIAKNRSVKIATRQGGSYTFRYADLESIIAATRPALAANGLAVLQPVQLHEGGTFLTTMLTHSGGGLVSFSLPIPTLGTGPDSDPKAYGALLSYLRRYAYTALLCLAADDDLDADGGGGRGLASERLAFHLVAIADAPNVGELRAAYAAASEEAQAAGDSDALRRFAKARDDKVASARKEADASA